MLKNRALRSLFDSEKTFQNYIACPSAQTKKPLFCDFKNLYPPKTASEQKCNKLYFPLSHESTNHLLPPNAEKNSQPNFKNGNNPSMVEHLRV